jgi:hypothetical protein
MEVNPFPHQHIITIYIFTPHFTSILGGLVTVAINLCGQLQYRLKLVHNMINAVGQGKFNYTHKFTRE